MSLACQAWQLESDSWEPLGGRREPIPPGYPLASLCAPTPMCAVHVHIHKSIDAENERPQRWGCTAAAGSAYSDGQSVSVGQPHTAHLVHQADG